MLSLALASGYHGPPELTVARAFTEWTARSAGLLAFVLLLGGALPGRGAAGAPARASPGRPAGPWRSAGSGSASP